MSAEGHDQAWAAVAVGFDAPAESVGRQADSRQGALSAIKAPRSGIRSPPICRPGVLAHERDLGGGFGPTGARL